MHYLIYLKQNQMGKEMKWYAIANFIYLKKNKIKSTNEILYIGLNK